MLTLQNIFVADFEVYRETSVLIIIGVIILLIVIIVLILLGKSPSSNNHNQHAYDQNNIGITETRNNDKAPRNDYDRLFQELSSLKEANRELNERVYLLEKNNKGLNLELDEYYMKYGKLNSSNSGDKIFNPSENFTTIASNPIDHTIAVSFSFEEKNGTVKVDDLGDMYLEKSGDYYELLFGKEIYGTAIHLEQLQYCYKILNPKEANNKPMLVIKKPKYLFDQSDEKGILYQKGEVKYQ